MEPQSLEPSFQMSEPRGAMSLEAAELPVGGGALLESCVYMYTFVSQVVVWSGPGRWLTYSDPLSCKQRRFLRRICAEKSLCVMGCMRSLTQLRRILFVHLSKISFFHGLTVKSWILESPQRILSFWFMWRLFQYIIYVVYIYIYIYMYIWRVYIDIHA